MARLLAIDTCAVSLRNALLKHLRGVDEAILLPGANRSLESNVFKNVAFRLSGETADLDPAIFSPQLFDGLSVIRLHEKDRAALEGRLKSVNTRKELLQKLAAAIPSELADAELSVGPPLDGADDERDAEDAKWEAGLDSCAAFAGVFSAENSRPPEPGRVGLNRVHRELYLVVRAGGGLSASTFYARLRAALAAGTPLDAALETGAAPGPRALRRVSLAGSRNRGRILKLLADQLGLTRVDSVPDMSARNKYRVVVADVDIVVNGLRKVDNTARSTWQYTAGLDGALSKGACVLSNPSDGVVLFETSTTGSSAKISISNDFFQSLPFVSRRLKSARDVVKEVVDDAKERLGHVDDDWIRERFAWRNAPIHENAQRVVPLGLCGAFQEESFLSKFSRELAVDGLNVVRLRPELVVVAGCELGKLRALVRSF
jgi:hypothetical protein